MAGTRSTAGRDAIAAAALATFSARGYDGASIRDIAQEAGLSLSAMYYYFSSKEDALFTLVRDAFESFLKGALAVTSQAGDSAPVKLDSLIRYLVRYRIENRETSQLIIHEADRLTGENHATVRRLQVDTNHHFLSVVNLGIQQGSFLTPYPEDAVRSIIAMCNAISLWYRTDGNLTVDEVQSTYAHLAFCLVEGDPVR